MIYWWTLASHWSQMHINITFSRFKKILRQMRRWTSPQPKTGINNNNCIIQHVQRTRLSAGVYKYVTRNACVKAAINTSCYQWWSEMQMQCDHVHNSRTSQDMHCVYTNIHKLSYHMATTDQRVGLWIAANNFTNSWNVYEKYFVIYSQVWGKTARELSHPHTSGWP